jgi:hypothetical protein
MQFNAENKHEERKDIRKNTHSRLHGTYIKVYVIKEKDLEKKRSGSRLI